jgi:hypothetical protein
MGTEEAVADIGGEEEEEGVEGTVVEGEEEEAGSMFLAAAATACPARPAAHGRQGQPDEDERRERGKGPWRGSSICVHMFAF